MLPANQNTYGGIFVDAKPVEVAVQEQSAAFANELHKDVAELTLTAFRGWVHFLTSGAAPGALTVVSAQSWAGTGSGQAPVVSKTGTGLYQVVYPTTYTNGLGVVEAIVLKQAKVELWGVGVRGHAYVGSVLNQTATIEVTNTADTLSDLGGTAKLTLWVI